MKKTLRLATASFCAVWMMWACSHKATAPTTSNAAPVVAEPVQEPEKELTDADKLAVEWGVIGNNYNNEFNFKSLLSIKNNGTEPLKENWTLYFNFARHVKSESVTGNVEITHINGDYFKVTPKPGFRLEKGATVNIEFLASDWAINYSDAPSGLYFVFKKDKNDAGVAQAVKSYKKLPFDKPEQFKRFAGDNAPQQSAALVYEQNKNIDQSGVSELPLIPSPVSYKQTKMLVQLDNSYIVVAKVAGLENESSQLTAQLNKAIGLNPSVATSAKAGQKVIELSVGDITHEGKKLGAGSEAYQLVIAGDKITIKGSDKAGLFYGVESLVALLPVSALQAKNGTAQLSGASIVDYPRFHYRGFVLDVARNFKSKENVLKVLDLLAYYKINKFHFHCTDDEGWRVEIPGLPELTEIGSKRLHTTTEKDGLYPSFASGPNTNSLGSGFYTRQDYIEILKYAKARHIEVIPEVDGPGHSRAAIKSMNVRYDRFMAQGNKEEAEKYLLRDLNDASVYSSVQMWNDNVLNIGVPGTYTFLEKVIDEIVAMHKEAGIPLTSMHIGGDEIPEGVWKKSPACQELAKKDPSVDITSSRSLFNYYLKRMSEILNKRNLSVAGWEEIALKKETKDGVTQHVSDDTFLKNKFIPYAWNTIWGWGDEDNAYKMANAGYDVVLVNANSLYFDLAYDKDPAEPGYYWAAFIDARQPFEYIPLDIYKNAYVDRMGNKINQKDFDKKVRLNKGAEKHILGIQGALWAENQVTAEIMEYLLLPKLISLSEKAWAKAPAWEKEADETKRIAATDKDWSVFAATVGKKELPRLDYVFGEPAYRIPTPGAVVENGLIKANIQYPGLIIRYTTDGSEPTVMSPVYKEPIQKQGTVTLRAFSAGGHAGRSVVVK